jgi:HlyD family secretion protein
MNKKVKWVLIIAGILAAFFVGANMLKGKDKEEKVALEKATRRTIVETVNASGKVYPDR